jgi:hypothetical protein
MSSSDQGPKIIAHSFLFRGHKSSEATKATEHQDTEKTVFTEIVKKFRKNNDCSV